MSILRIGKNISVSGLLFTSGEQRGGHIINKRGHTNFSYQLS
jgi:hypothetical protein